MKKKKLFSLLIGLVILVVVGGVLYFYISSRPKEVGSNHLNTDYKQLTSKQKLTLGALEMSYLKPQMDDAQGKHITYDTDITKENEYVVFNKVSSSEYTISSTKIHWDKDKLFVYMMNVKTSGYEAPHIYSLKKLAIKYADSKKYQNASKALVTQAQKIKYMNKKDDEDFEKASEKQQLAVMLYYAWASDHDKVPISGANFEVYLGSKDYIYFTNVNAGLSNWAEHTYRYVIGNDGQYTMQYAQVPDGMTATETTMKNVQWQTIISMSGGMMYGSFKDDSQKLISKMNMNYKNLKNPEERFESQ